MMKPYFHTAYQFLVFLICCLFSLSSFGQTKNSPKGFIDFNGQVNQLLSTNLSINSLLIFNKNFSYFSTMNHCAAVGSRDLNGHYHEHQGYFHAGKASMFDLVASFATVSGDNNDALQLGARFNFTEHRAIKAWATSNRVTFFSNVYVYQVARWNDQPWMNQVQAIYQWVLPVGVSRDRVYVRGFASAYFSTFLPGKTMFVTEHQCGLRIVDQWHLTAEYRLNHFTTHVHSLALGLEYLIKL